MRAARKLLEQRFCCCCSSTTADRKLAGYGANKTGVPSGKTAANGVSATYTAQNGKAPTIITTQPSGRSRDGKDRVRYVSGVNEQTVGIVANCPEPGEFDEIDLNDWSGESPPPLTTTVGAEDAPPLSDARKASTRRDDAVESARNAAVSKTATTNTALADGHGGEHHFVQQQRLAEAVTDMMLNEIQKTVDEADECDTPLVEEDASNIDLYAISEANNDELAENSRFASGSSTAKAPSDDGKSAAKANVVGKSSTPNEQSRDNSDDQIAHKASVSRSVSTSSVCSTATLPSTGSSGGTPSPRKPPRTNLHMMFNSDDSALSPTSPPNNNTAEEEADRGKVKAASADSTYTEHGSATNAESIPPSTKVMRTNRMYADVDEESSDDDEKEEEEEECEPSKNVVDDCDEKLSSYSVPTKGRSATTAVAADLQTTRPCSTSESNNNSNENKAEPARATQCSGAGEHEHAASKASDGVAEVQLQQSHAPKVGAKQFDYNALESDPSEKTN